MQTKNAVVPIDLGQQFTWNAAIKKWEIKIGTGLSTDSNGNIIVTPGFEKHTTGMTFDDNTGVLKITRNDGVEITTDITGVVPVHKKDVFLSAVSYNDVSKELEYTIANGGGDNIDTTITVDIADLVPVSTSDGVQGNGTVADPVRLKLDSSKDGGLLKIDDGSVVIDISKFTRLTNTDGSVTLGYIISDNSDMQSTIANVGA